ncbi:hypothetical protein [Staphylococcus simulans]|uniref:hypothetical protein n=1 Tax=Staphylococcus simulans TaxID=1286 RepID=UPI00399AA243
MSQVLHEQLQFTLLDLNDDVKAELSELNQLKDNVTKGPDYKLFERGIMHAVIQGKRQMIDSLQNQINAAENDHDILALIESSKQALEAKREQLHMNMPSNQPAHQAYYNEGLTLAQLYETQGKYYVIQVISDKINIIQSED